MQSSHGSLPSRSHWCRRRLSRSRFASTTVFAVFALSSLSYAQIPAALEQADLFLKNGKVFVDKTTGRQWEEAISVRDGIILSIGTTKALEKEVGPNTKVIDLKGKWVFPAFIDANTDFMKGAWALGKLQSDDASSTAKLKEAFLNAQRLAHQHGIASIQGSLDLFENTLPLEDQLKLLHDLWSEKKLTLRVALRGSLQNTEAFSRLKEKYNKDLHEDWVRLSCVYAKVDGELLEQTAALHEPYTNNSQTSGTPLFSQQQLNEMVLKANRLGLPVCLSAQGDNAASMALSALAKAKRQLFNSRIRNQVFDVFVVPKGAFGRFADFGIVPSVSPTALTQPAVVEKTLDALLGKVRVKNTLPLKSLLKTRNHLSIGSDWPVFSLNPLDGIFGAVYRQSTAGKPYRGWVPEQKISLEQAFEAATFGGAYATHEDHVKGTLREGKYADLVVFDKNLLRTREKELLKLQPNLTVVGGKVVHDNSIPQLKVAD